MITIRGLIVFLCVVVVQSSYTFEDCERWAKEGECINNPRFIWVHCLSSCVAHATDDNENCRRWREEGECSANKRYVPLHCPRSCELSIAWHPSYRNALHFDPSFQQPAPPDHTPDVAWEYVGHKANGDKCPSLIENEVYHSAITMQSRIVNILKYGHYMGYAKDSPSEFLQSYGLIEGILYTLRLYDIILSTSRVASRAEKRVQEIIHDIERSLNHYDGNRMTLQMMECLRLLEEAGHLVSAFLKGEMYRIRQTYAMNDDGAGCPELLRLDIDDIHLIYGTPTVPTGELISTAQSKNAPPVFTLSNGVDMTSLGLGTWKLNGDTCEKVVYDAIKIGYRAIDTAQAYGNEAEVGRAVKKAIDEGIVTRDELFIATKLSFEEDAGYDKVMALVQRQLESLQTDYIDLYYIHSQLSSNELTHSTWAGMEKMYKSGTIRSLGLSNHNSDQLRHHIHVIGPDSVHPMVLQNKYDVYHPGKQLDNKGDFILQTCKELKVQLVGYSPFSSFPFSMLPLDDPIVGAVASHRSEEELANSAAVLTQWSLQQGIALIPRSSNVDNLATNYAAAVAVSNGLIEEKQSSGSAVAKGLILSPNDMALLSSLSNLVSTSLVKPNYGS